MKRLIFSIFILPLFLACAHVSEKDCIEKDWQTVGMNDALAGHGKADMRKIAESCSRFTMANPPEFQYSTGYDAGLKQYCNEGRGYSYGQRGQRYPAVCVNAESRFPELIKGWKEGVDAYCNYDQGKSYGIRGEHPNQFCARSTHPQYFSGFASGAHLYCTAPETGFERGKRGEERFGYCPTELSGPFERAYHQGAKLFSEISVLKKRIKTLHDHEYQANQRDRNAESSIRDFERKIKSLDHDTETLEKKETRLQSDLRDCARHNDLCSNSHIDGLESDLSRTSKKKSESRRLSKDYSLKLPGLYSERTRAAIELGNLKFERTNLERELARLNSKGYIASRP